MFLVSAVFFGFVVWAAYLVLKRLAFYERVTPLCYIVTIVMGITTETILVVGINIGAWGIATSHLIAMYTGLGYAMKLVGDFDYYWAKYRQHNKPEIFNEDHHNWPKFEHRP